MSVTVSGAPGYADGWHATLIGRATAIDGRQLVVVESDGDWFVVPSHSVTEDQEPNYDLCPNGQTGRECREIDPCEPCWQDWNEGE
jgi:hypothetical protein